MWRWWLREGCNAHSQHVLIGKSAPDCEPGTSAELPIGACGDESLGD